ncbi:MAG: Ig-like domain-containing protein, partial [Bacteroidota bacterium]
MIYRIGLCNTKQPRPTNSLTQHFVALKLAILSAIFFGFGFLSNAQSTQIGSYTNPGTYSFTVPAGVTSIIIQAWGGGGGAGGSSASIGGGGGGGGAFSRSQLSVTPGQTYEVVIGTGGQIGLSSGTGNTSGGTGGDTRFGAGSGLVLAKGGFGGVRANSGGGGASGGQASAGIGTLKFSGGSGGSGGDDGGGGGGSSAGTAVNGNNGFGNGGFGGSAPTGGGAGGNASGVTNGSSGQAPGGGGGGSDDVSSSSGNGAGGAGGRMIIECANIVGTPVFNLGATSTRCQGAGTVTYTATASNTTNITYSLNASSISAGNTINTSTGAVTYVAGYTGTAIITATATGCGGQKTATHTVTMTPFVATPVFALGATSNRCIGAGSVTYTATAANSTGISYSLDATSLGSGNSINTSTGQVTYTNNWSGTATITATATGCGSPASATHQVTAGKIIAVNDSYDALIGVPLTFNVLANDLCNINPSTVTITQQPSAGFLQVGANGSITYVVIGTFTGIDQFKYQVCSNPPVECKEATVSISVTDGVGNACAEANKSAVYYLPFPENNTQLRQSLLSAASANNLSTNARTIVSIAIPYPGTIIRYDHWEDGYEADIENSNQSTTLVWGDADLTNGVAPGYPTDLIPAGGKIVIDNSFPWSRPTSTIVFDGKDKIFSSAAITVSKVSGDAGIVDGTTALFDVQTVKTNVSDVTRFGQFFVLPFGENVTLNSTSAFRYAGLFARAEENGTIITVDLDGNGTIDVTSPTINQGQVWFYNGTGSTPGVATDINTSIDIKAGAKVYANKNVGLDLVFGGIDTYGTRNIPILPGQFYGSTYYSPVYSTDAAAPVYAFFVNPNTTAITVNWSRAVGSPLTGSFNVAANNGISVFNMNTASGMKFQSTGGKAFTAVSVVDGDAAGADFDWAFNMIPEQRLTSFASIAWAPGSSNNSANYNPIWVTPSQATTIYVKYNGNILAGPNTSPCGAKYDVSYTLSALQSQLIADPDNDNSGLAVWSCNDIPMAAVWGQRPFGGTPTFTPAIDVGYTMEPKCLGALVFANDERRVTPQNTPILIDVPANDAAYLTTLNLNSVTITTQPANGTVSIGANGQVTYTPKPGFTGEDEFKYTICGQAPDNFNCDEATVYIRVPCLYTPGFTSIAGSTFTDINLNGVANNGEIGVGSINVELYEDLDGDGVLDAGEPLLQTQPTATGANIGKYQFDFQSAFTYIDNFNTNGSATGTNGTQNWSAAPWTKIVDAGNFSSNNIQVILNQLQIQGNALATQAGAQRTANMAGAATASLSFSYNKTVFSSATTDFVDVQVASSASGPWTTLVRYSGTADATGSATFIVPPALLSATTTIRFIESDNSNFATTERVLFDDVNITYEYNKKYLVKLASPIPNGWTLTSSPAVISLAPIGSPDGFCGKNFGLAKADLQVVKQVDNSTPVVGQNVVFTIAVTNNGPNDAPAVVVSDALTTGFTYVSDNGGGAYNQATGVWTIGALALNASATLQITAKVKVAGVFTNTATVSSGLSDGNTANNTSIVTLSPVWPLVAVNDENSTWAGFPVTGNVLPNDFSQQDFAFSFSSFTDAVGTPISSGSVVGGVNSAGVPVANAGTLTFDANGNYTFTPAPGFIGTVSIPYKICYLAYATSCSTADLDITVSELPYNGNSVIANNDEYFSHGSAVSGDTRVNDSDPQGHSFTVTSYRYDSNGDGVPDATGSLGSAVNIGGVDFAGTPVTNAGSLTFNSNGTFNFVPVPGFIGTVDVLYNICDVASPQACTPAIVTITVLPNQNGAANDAPIAGDDFSYTKINKTVNGNFITNDIDLNANPVRLNGTTINTAGAATSITTLATAKGGTVEFFANGTYKYTPPAGYVGPDNVVYEICDVTAIAPQPLCANATIHMLVGSDNTTHAVNDQNNTWVDVPVGGSVIINDFDLEGHTQTFTNFLNSGGTPISSGAVVSGVDRNGSPVANAGTLTFDASGNYVFTPAAGFTGDIKVPYVICDNGYLPVCDQALLTITVSPMPYSQNSVIANNDAYFTFNTPISGNLVLNDADPQANSFAVTSFRFDSNGDGTPDAAGTLASPVNVGGVDASGIPVANAGSLTLNANGTFTFVPVVGFIGTADLEYTICDNAAIPSCDKAIVTLTVLPDQNGAANNTPIPGDDFTYTNVNTPATGNFAGNDKDPNGNPISVNGITINTGGPATSITVLTTEHGGTVEMFANGSYLYTPTSGYQGPDKVVYVICDVTVVAPQPLCADATIYLLVGTTIRPTVTVSGNVWNDVNGNAVNGGESPITSGVWVNLVDPATNDVIQSVQADISGNYSFPGVWQNTGYNIILSNLNQTGNLNLTASVLPPGFVNTGTNLSGIANTSNQTGVIAITTGTIALTNQNFGIEQPPTAGSGSNNGGTNPGGAIQVVVPANTFTNTAFSIDPTLVTAIRLTVFPTGATTIVIGGVSYPTLTAIQAAYPNGIPTDPTGAPVPSITVDPTQTGNTSVTISFKAVDAAGQLSSNTGTAVLNFTAPTTISGNVWNDVNGNAINSSETAITSGVWVNLVNPATNDVIQSVQVDGSGNYSFSGLPQNTGFNIILSSSNETGNLNLTGSTLP